MTYCHGVWCRGAGVQVEGAGGIQININIRIYFKHTGRKTGKQEQTPGNIKHRPTKTDWRRWN